MLDDKNEIVSFDSKLTSKQTMIRKNLSDSDLADDEVDDSSSDSSMDDTATVNPWSNRLHHHHHSSNELAKKRGRCSSMFNCESLSSSLRFYYP